MGNFAQIPGQPGNHYGKIRGKKGQIRTTQVFHDYYSRLKTIAVNLFKWEGLPDSCNARFLEDCLFHFGEAIFVFDPDFGLINLKCNPSGELNIYGEPVSMTAHSFGYTEVVPSPKIPNGKFVRVWNNPLLKSTESTIVLFAERLALLEMAAAVNVNSQKTPILVQCDDKSRKTMEAIYSQYEENRSVIFIGRNLDDQPLQSLVTNAPFVADKLQEQKRQVWNEALEFLGLNTNPSEKKKERLITNEVEANNEQIDIQALTMYQCREAACQQLNDLFGLNVTVSKRVEDFQPEPEEMGEEDNG